MQHLLDLLPITFDLIYATIVMYKPYFRQCNLKQLAWRRHVNSDSGNNVFLPADTERLSKPVD